MSTSSEQTRWVGTLGPEQKDMLAEVLRQRFGPLPDGTRERFDALTHDQLGDLWFASIGCAALSDLDLWLAS